MNNTSNNNINNINSITFFNSVLDKGIDGINEMIASFNLPEDDLQGLIMELKEHCRNLFALAQEFQSTYDPREEEISALSDELRSFFNIYVRPFKYSLDEELSQKVCFDETLSEEEQKIYNEYCLAIKEESGKRLCNNDKANSYNVIIYSIRLCRLLNLKAPLVVCANEAHDLAESMVALKYGFVKPYRES